MAHCQREVLDDSGTAEGSEAVVKAVANASSVCCLSFS